MQKNIFGDINFYFGKNIGQHILDEMDTAKKSICIVSPYLSLCQVDFLIKKARQGIKISVVTQQEAMKNMDELYKKIITQHKILNKKQLQKRKKGKLFSFFLAMISIIFIAIGNYLRWNSHLLLVLFSGLGLFFVLLFIRFSVMKIYAYQYSTIFQFFVMATKPKENCRPDAQFVHAKIYVIDDKKVFIGSANFTWSGFKKNVEVAASVENKDLCNSIKREIKNILNSTSLIDIASLGSRLYHKCRR